MRNLFALLGSTELATAILAASSLLVARANAFSFPGVAPSNLDLSQLGRVAIAGDFDSISLYQFEGQSQNGANKNGSQSLLSRYPTGAFAALQSSDAYIEAMCPFIMSNGSLAGIIVGGNFTSLGGVEAQGIALFTPQNGQVTPLQGLNGTVQAVYCDKNSSTVYVGGSFTGPNCSNAIAWTTGWTNLPFAGFNGPVTSITKAPNGHIVFGGKFDGLGNTTTPENSDGQVIPIPSAQISAGPSTTQSGFSDPQNILCPSNQTGSGNTWLLADKSPGALTATFKYGFVPSMLRVWNTNQDGRGTKTFRYTAIPLNGIMNFTYTDPMTGKQEHCDATCPLPQGNTTYQDFQFVNPIGMTGFRLDISAWYGAGAGLNGIQLFANDISAFAVNDFNEPTCAGLSYPASATTTGPWTTATAATSSSEFLTASLSGSPVDPNSASVVFQPDIPQSGNYSVTIYTPGCVSDGSCGTRGRVDITGQVNNGNSTLSAQIFQTNNFDKYDQVYIGFVDATSDSFKPTITLAPAPGQNAPLTIVAQRVRFELLSSTGGLNGIFEYNPGQAVVSTNFAKSAIDSAGMSLNHGAIVSALATEGNTLYVAGNFSGNGISNIMAFGNSASSLSEGGLNGAVNAMYPNGSAIYVGGSFTGTTQNKTTGLNGVAAFNTSTNTWSALGAGINGVANYVVPFQVNLTTSSTTELAIAVSGTFTQVNAFGSNPSIPVENFAVWVPGRKNWLQNLGLPSITLQGILTVECDIPGYNTPLFGGNVASGASSASDTVGLATGGLGLKQLPIEFEEAIAAASSNSSKRKRDVGSSKVGGIVTGLMYNQNKLNMTIFGGHFTAKASNGSAINSLLIVNGSNSDAVTGFSGGVSTDSVVTSLGTSGTLLFAGGQISGNVNGNDVQGLVVYDLKAAGYATTQPPALTGSSVTVNAIAPQPSSTNVFVGGNFTGAGSFNCPSLCTFDTSRLQWGSPGNGLSGTVNSMTWIGTTKMIIGGALNINGNSTSVATYDPKAQSFTAITSKNGPTGTVTAVTPGSSDGTQIWVGGQNTDGSAFLSKYNGTAWNSPSSKLFGPGTMIKGLQIFMLTEDHGSSTWLRNHAALLILGQINVPNFGNSSAALFNGTTLTPFLLSNGESGIGGSSSQVFVENPENFFKSGGKFFVATLHEMANANNHVSAHKLATGFIVLIALAVSLAVMFLVIVAGIAAERWRRKRDGYTVAPQMSERHANMERLPPEELFGSVGRAR